MKTINVLYDNLLIKGLNKEEIELLLRPTSLKSMIILGKDSDEVSYLLRYFSTEVQKHLLKSDFFDKFRDAEMIGIYDNCQDYDTLPIFNDKKQEEKLKYIYGYYWGLSNALRIINFIIDLAEESQADIYNGNEIVFVYEFSKFFVHNDAFSMKDTRHFLREECKKIEMELHKEKIVYSNIENVVPISTLAFKLPELIKECFPIFKNKTFVYLIDGFEKYSELQQKIINTLIKMKNGCCTFRIGGYLHGGIKTYETLKTGEIIRDGDDFDDIIIEVIKESIKSSHENE